MKNHILYISFLSLFFLVSCRVDSPPIITTNPVSNITFTTATSGGSVFSDGGDPVIARGLCWSTTPNPTIIDNISTENSDNFTTTLSGLNQNTQYFVRAYATNSIGTAYGAEETFQTNNLENTSWVIILVDDVIPGIYEGKIGIDFKSAFVTQAEDHDYPGIYYTGSWSVSGDKVNFNPGFDPLNVSYIFDASVNQTNMSGIYSWGATAYKNFTGSLLP